MAKKKKVVKLQKVATHSLKVLSGATDGKIEPAGYINIVEKLILNQAELEGFEKSTKKERTRKLAAWATVNVGGFDSFLGQPDDTGASFEEVSESNCHVRADRDKGRNSNPNSPSKMTVPLPNRALELRELQYVDNFINAFLKIWYGDEAHKLQSTPDANINNARKFMFGVMMLTRCR